MQNFMPIGEAAAEKSETIQNEWITNSTLSIPPYTTYGGMRTAVTCQWRRCNSSAAWSVRSVPVACRAGCDHTGRWHCCLPRRTESWSHQAAKTCSVVCVFHGWHWSDQPAPTCTHAHSQWCKLDVFSKTKTTGLKTKTKTKTTGLKTKTKTKTTGLKTKTKTTSLKTKTKTTRLKTKTTFTYLLTYH